MYEVCIVNITYEFYSRFSHVNINVYVYIDRIIKRKEIEKQSRLI